MSTKDISHELDMARDEVASVFGEIYGDAYGNDLFLMRLLSSRGIRPRVIHDVGGSDGIWTAVASRVFPEARFEAFEPLAETSEDYKAAHAGNAVISSLFSSGRATMHPVALGAITGTCRMTVYPHEVGSTSIALDYQPEETISVEVPQWKLDEFIVKHRLPPPDLLKLDTQGSELEILRGARKTLRNVSAVLCECWLTKGYGSKTPLWIEIANCLNNYHLNLFDLGWVYRNGPDQRSTTIDMLFVREDLPFSHMPKRKTLLSRLMRSLKKRNDRFPLLSKKHLFR